MTINFNVDYVKNNEIHHVSIKDSSNNDSNAKIQFAGRNYRITGTSDEIKLISECLNHITNMGTLERDLKAKLLEHGAEKITFSAYTAIDHGTLLDPHQLVMDIISLMEKHYIFPEVGKRCGELLRTELQNGSYHGLTEPEALAQILMADLRQISEDKHIDIWPISDEMLSHSPPPKFIVKELAPGINYVDLFSFEIDNPKPLRELALSLQESKGIIIDLRNNGGGSPFAVQDQCSYFLDPELPLNTITYRTEDGDRLDTFTTLPYKDTPAEQRMITIPVYILTSHRTFSAAEEFANNMKELGRATIIGEVTGGGANPGKVHKIDHGMQIFIPDGRAENPLSGKNWESVGVIPDHLVDGEDALNVAFDLAQKA